MNLEDISRCEIGGRDSSINLAKEEDVVEETAIKTKPEANDLLDVEEDTACNEETNKEAKDHAT